MGVPQEDRMKLFHWSNQMVGDMDPEFADNDAISASVELITYGMTLAAERADSPGEDLVTKLVRPTWRVTSSPTTNSASS